MGAGYTPRTPIEPGWLIAARRYVGLSEIPGVEHSPTILRWLKSLKAAWLDDEVPWCGTYCAVCMSEAGIVLPQFWYRARDWLNWGVKLDAPIVGCIVVYSRTGGGHVGFVVGRDKAGNILTLGGNQRDMVSIKPFDPLRVLGYRWPEHEVLTISPLPIVNSSGQVSTQEG